ncbi:hypothetical protein HMI55_007089 [Coelomomyces lativittatus]|nr:hypothetical protein HMI55_007089 [Coelomomyces lativittatus]
MTTPTSLQTSTSSLSLSLSSSSHGHLTHAETQLLDCLASFPNHQATTDAVLDQLKPMDMTTLAMLMNGLLNKAMIDMKKNGQGQLMMTLVKLDEKQK